MDTTVKSQQDDDFEGKNVNPLHYSKKTLQKYGMIRQMKEEHDKLATHRKEVLKNDENATQNFRQKRAQSMKLWDTKDYDRLKQTYKIKNIIKESRETNQDFIQKKRQIFLSNMNIHHKREETNKLKVFIENEKQSLAQRIQYFENDKDLVSKFLIEIKKQADQQTNQAEQESKRKKDLIIELAKQKSKKDYLRQQIDKLKDEQDNLQKYKQFVDLMRKKHQDLIVDMTEEEIRQEYLQKKQQQLQQNKANFVTEVDQIEDQNDQDNNELRQLIEYYKNIPFKQQLLISIKDRDEEKNLVYVQQKNEWEDKLAEIKKDYTIIQQKYEQTLKDSKTQLKELERFRKELLEQRKNLKKQQISLEKKDDEKDSKNNTQRIQRQNNNENDDNNQNSQINFELIKKAIFKVYQKLDPEHNSINVDQYTTKEQMFAIETQINQYTTDQKKYQTMKPDVYKWAEKTIKAQQNERIKEEQKEALDQEKRRKYEIKKEKREKAVLNMRQGRKIQEKHIYQKTKKVVQEVVEKSDDDEKYFK